MTTESLAQALHAAERAWLVGQGVPNHISINPKIRGRDVPGEPLQTLYTACGFCGVQASKHSPLMVEWPDLPEPERGRYRALAAVAMTRIEELEALVDEWVPSV